ncbi:helix-turn-helix domain-containing protein, partial [Nonomuraea sp. NPDC050153]|uniref:helix-turn-helix domain-containing protein n=1 Tax=Nonomuraea sp. NPDC050153 TaxID=3364359 RepID=UPI0037898137
PARNSGSKRRLVVPATTKPLLVRSPRYEGKPSEAYVRGFQLSEIRQAAGATQAELADILGVSQARISKIEHGEVSGIDVV